MGEEVQSGGRVSRVRAGGAVVAGPSQGSWCWRETVAQRAKPSQQGSEGKPLSQCPHTGTFDDVDFTSSTQTVPSPLGLQF